MKKCCILLLAMLLLAVSGASAAAETPQELQAEGRALLTQTMKALQGSYTLTGGLYPQNDSGPAAYTQVVCNGEAIAFIRADGVRDIHFSAKVIRVYPERGAYHALPDANSAEYLPLLLPKELSENAELAVRRWFASLEISFDGCRYWYKDGALWSADGSPVPEIQIESFTQEADAAIFSLDGLREVSQGAKWRWDFREAFALHLQTHPRLQTAYDSVRSIGTTVLVVVFLPLLFLLGLVLKVLFYFDLYKV